MSSLFEGLLDELYTLTLKSELTEQENTRYIELVDTLHLNNIPIEFGVEV